MLPIHDNMKSFFQTKQGQVVGAGILLLIVVANLWLFLPRFVQENQELTAQKLTEQQEALSESADQAALIAGRVSQAKISHQQAVSELQIIQDEVDRAVLQLRTGKHQAEISEEVAETLKLAEVLSFTIRNYAAQSSDDSLASAQTAHILKMSAEQATQLAEK